MKLKLYNQEINVTKAEANKISEALINGVEFFKIGDEVINSKYVIGVFEGGEVEPNFERMIQAPKYNRDFGKIGDELKKVKDYLKDKKII